MRFVVSLLSGLSEVFHRVSLLCGLTVVFFRTLLRYCMVSTGVTVRIECRYFVDRGFVTFRTGRYF